MGVVYRAEDTKLKRQVPLKFLPQYSLAEKSALERFEREARAASALHHPYICAIHDIAQGPGAAGHQLTKFHRP
jgi:serine/threonine protein kinase